MKLGFCLFKYFPFGGLQRDFLRIATECQQRGHHIRVYVFKWEGERPKNFEIIEVPKKGLTSPASNRAFVKFVQRHLKAHPIDYLIGFNKIPGLDCYYAADGCYWAKAQQQRNGIYRYSPRFRHYQKYESEIFNQGQSTEILMISDPQMGVFQHLYHTESNRLHLLPPGIERDRIAPENADDADRERQSFRSEFAIKKNQWLLLMVGSGFKTKGLDRTLRALKALPNKLRKNVQLFVVGQDNPRPFEALAAKLDITSQVRFFQGRDDIPRFLLGADILVHPAYHENAGMVLLEALVAGLPVLVTDICGYAHYIEQAEAGMLLNHPFQQETMNQCLQQMMNREQLEQWHNNALLFAKTADLHSMPQTATDIIEKLCLSKLDKIKTSHSTPC